MRKLQLILLAAAVLTVAALVVLRMRKADSSFVLAGQNSPAPLRQVAIMDITAISDVQYML